MIKDIFGEDFAHDFNLMKGKNFKIMNMINRKTFFKEYSEYNPINYGITDNLFMHTVLMKYNSKKGKASGVKRVGCKNTHIVYINGMMTQEEMAIYQKEYISKMLHQDIELIQNRHCLS